MEKDISKDLDILQGYLDGMLDKMQHNSLTLKRFQDFEIKLLKLTSLPEMINHILDDTKTFLGLDVISFCLIDKHGLIEEFLQNDAYIKK